MENILKVIIILVMAVLTVKAIRLLVVSVTKEADGTSKIILKREKLNTSFWNYDPAIEIPFNIPISILYETLGRGGLIPNKEMGVANLINKADLILVGKANKIGYSLDFKIVELLKGTTSETNVVLTSKTVEQIGYFKEGSEYILFLSKKEDEVFTFAIPHTPEINILEIYEGVEEIYPLFGPHQLYDIKLLLTAYKRNKELFSSREALFYLYPRLKSDSVKYRFLFDLEGIAGKEDIPRLREWQRLEMRYNVTAYWIIDQIKFLIGKIEEKW